ncbi:hypothetical protein [Thermococcus celericrescens]|nr:hypothetical protein [Thermococcus celericrescens]
MLCVALAGAFFDWLPLPTGWMKAGGEINKTFLKLHVAVTFFFFKPRPLGWGYSKPPNRP